MKVDYRAFASIRKMVSHRDLRCRECGALLEPVADPSGQELIINREPAEPHLRCPACQTSHPLPDDFEKKPAARLTESKDRPDRQPPDICPECGARMEPDGGCFFCRSCGYSQCG